MLDPSILVGTAAQPPVPVPIDPAAQADGGGADQVEPGRSELWPAETMAATIELLMEMDVAANLDSALQRLARRLQSHLSANRVLVLSRQSDRLQFTVSADTAAAADPERSACRTLVAAAEETVVRGGQAHWPPTSVHQRHALLATAQLSEQFDGAPIESIALDRRSGPLTFVIVVVGAAEPQTGRFLQVIGNPLASRIDAIRRSEPSRLETWYRRLTALARSKQRRIALSAIGITILLLLLPLRYVIRADLELQPIQHRYVAVPFDGPLQSAHVRPGDTVDQGDLLASINPREIDYELAGIRAELNRAVQERKARMAEHDSAGGKIAALESDRLRFKNELLQYRRGNLQIRSPLSGLVVSGDWKQSEGIPLSRGDTLFEIAPLGQMVVELSIAEDDFAHVRRGMPVQFQVHSFPGRSISGTISRIHPRAELRDHDNVFIAEVLVDDPDYLLRPGMRGSAKISGDRHTLVWNLFHKPYYALRRGIGW